MSLQQVGSTGNAFASGILAATVAFGAPGNQVVASATTYTLTIFTQVQKTPSADTANTRDNNNEIINMRRSNQTMQLRFSAKANGTNVAASVTTNANCPLKGDVVVITCGSDTQIAGTAYVDTAEVSQTPEGETVMDLTVTKYPNTFAVIS